MLNLERDAVHKKDADEEGKNRVGLDHRGKDNGLAGFTGLLGDHLDAGTFADFRAQYSDQLGKLWNGQD